MNPEQQPQGVPVNPSLLLQEYKIRLHEAIDQNAMVMAYVSQLTKQIEELQKENEALKQHEGQGVKMQAGDIIFVGGNGPIDRLIRVFDHGPYNHVAIFVSDTEILEAQYNTKVHVIKNPYHEPNYVTNVVSMKMTDEQVAKLNKLKDQYLGEGYDFGEIFLIFLRLEFGIRLGQFNCPDEQICSELVARLLVGLGLADNKAIDLAPNELFKYLNKKGY